MCNFHYQGFIDSINELLQVKSQAAKLKVRSVGNLEGDLMSSEAQHAVSDDEI